MTMYGRIDEALRAVLQMAMSRAPHTYASGGTMQVWCCEVKEGILWKIISSLKIEAKISEEEGRTLPTAGVVQEN